MNDFKIIDKKTFFKALNGKSIAPIELAFKMKEVNISPTKDFHINMWRLIEDGELELDKDLRLRKSKHGN